jgi:hypothetical protein
LLNVLYFAFGVSIAGRLLFRSRTGEMNGTLRLEGGPQPLEFPQIGSYSSTIEALP